MTEKTQQPDGEILERTKPDVTEPPLYRVVLHNDDYSTMEFVIEVLETIFNKQPAEAYRIMLQVHTQQRGLCGLYPYEVAETKVAAVHEAAKTNGFPLRSSMEPE